MHEGCVTQLANLDSTHNCTIRTSILQLVFHVSVASSESETSRANKLLRKCQHNRQQTASKSRFFCVQQHSQVVLASRQIPCRRCIRNLQESVKNSRIGQGHKDTWSRPIRTHPIRSLIQFEKIFCILSFLIHSQFGAFLFSGSRSQGTNVRN